MVPKLCFPSRLERAARVPGFASTRGAGSKKTITPAWPVVALFGSTGYWRGPGGTKLFMGGPPRPLLFRAWRLTPTQCALPLGGGLETPLTGTVFYVIIGATVR